VSALTSRQRRRLVAVGRVVAFSLAPVVALLVAGELLARVLASAPASEVDAGDAGDAASGGLSMVPHPTRIWSLAPGLIHDGGVTHRIREDQLRAVPETDAPLRALTLGDSSIFGHGLEDQDTLHVQLAAALASRELRVDVYCGGVPGYSTEQSLVLLDETGWGLEPDLLVVGNLWSDNDFQYFVDREWLAALNSPLRRLDRALAWSVAWERLRSLQRPEAARDGALPIGWVREPYPTREGRRRVPLADYAANLDAMLAAAADRDVGAVVLAPANRHRLEPDGSLVMWDAYFEAMRLVAERRNVLVVDAVETLDGLTLDEAFLDEMHPTGRANARYGEALAAALVSAGWPEARLIPERAPPLAAEWVDVFAK